MTALAQLLLLRMPLAAPLHEPLPVATVDLSQGRGLGLGDGTFDLVVVAAETAVAVAAAVVEAAVDAVVAVVAGQVYVKFAREWGQQSSLIDAEWAYCCC